MILIFISILILLGSCSNPMDEGNSHINLDLRPPVLKNIKIVNETSIRIFFDEPIIYLESNYISEPSISLKKAQTEDNCLYLEFGENQKVGTMYKLSSEVADKRGNSLSFIIRFYGWNPYIPNLVLNELNPAGSGNNPDTIELYADTDGNIGGVSLFIGTSNIYKYSFILPPLEVKKGDYIILHMRPEGIASEINEQEDKSESSGKLSSIFAWDLWAKEDKPLSGKNGIITLYTNPFGEILDMIVYSNRVTTDSEKYKGWTSSTIKMIEELSLMDQWNNTDGFIRPEDAIYSEKTTGTRSICRNSHSEDNDLSSDWHIVPTGEKSFGQVNTDNIYIP